MEKLTLSCIKDLIVDLYRKQPTTVDHLPYTEDFEWLFDQVESRSLAIPLDRHVLWELIITLRKAGWLELKEKVKSKSSAKKLLGRDGFFKELGREA